MRHRKSIGIPLKLRNEDNGEDADAREIKEASVHEILSTLSREERKDIKEPLTLLYRIVDDS